MSNPIRAGHSDTVLDAELRKSQDDNILRREKARDAQRAAGNPTPAAPPPPARLQPAKPPTPRRAPTPTPTPPLPPGSLVLSPEEAAAVVQLINSHPETQKR